MSTSQPTPQTIPRFYLCVDCGGTKTAVSLATPTGEIVARALGGPSNFAYVGLDAFLIAVSTAVNTTLSIALSLPLSATSSDPSKGLIGAGEGRYKIEAAWLGVSGVDSPTAIAQLTPAISALLGIPAGPRSAITNDVHLLGAPLATLEDVRSAVAVIGGTGSIVVSFRESKPIESAQVHSEEGEGGASASGGEPLQEIARVGGWGWILGDEGGGFDVGRTALRHLLKQRDEQSAGIQPIPSTPGPLLSSILERFKINDLLEVLGAVHVPDPVAETKGGEGEYDYRMWAREKRLSGLSPLVFRAALEEGDGLAMEVLRDCAGKLASQIATVLASPDAVEPEVSLFFLPNSLSFPRQLVGVNRVLIAFWANGIQARRVPASTSVISFGGSLVALESYRTLVLEQLRKRGHVFKHMEVVNDASSAGAKALVAAWEGRM